MAFRIAYVAQLRALWRRDSGTFLRVIDRTTGPSVRVRAANRKVADS